MSKIFIVFSIFLLSSFSFAVNDQVPVDRTIVNTSVYNNMVIIRYSPYFAGTQGCLRSDKSELTIELNSSSGVGEYIYSALLAAAMSGKKVGFGISGCYADRPKIYRVDVEY